MPARPPTSPSSPDSMTNKERMSLFCAPTAFITPISFLLSRTDVYIVFAMPMPPTTKEMTAIARRKPVRMLRIVPKIARICSGVMIRKSWVFSSTSRADRRRFSALAATSDIVAPSSSCTMICPRDPALSGKSSSKSSSGIRISLSSCGLPTVLRSVLALKSSSFMVIVSPSSTGWESQSDEAYCAPSPTFPRSPDWRNFPWSIL